MNVRPARVVALATHGVVRSNVSVKALRCTSEGPSFGLRVAIGWGAKVAFLWIPRIDDRSGHRRIWGRAELPSASWWCLLWLLCRGGWNLCRAYGVRWVGPR